MSRRYDIQNLEQLHEKVIALKADYRLRGDRLNSDMKQFAGNFTLSGLVRKYVTPNSLIKLDDKLNISGSVMSVLLPLLMNKTIFKGSGLITKLLVSLTSGKFGKALDAETMTGIFNAFRSWIGGKKKKSGDKAEFKDYGIPPDSETY